MTLISVALGSFVFQANTLTASAMMVESLFAQLEQLRTEATRIFIPEASALTLSEAKERLGMVEVTALRSIKIDPEALVFNMVRFGQ